MSVLPRTALTGLLLATGCNANAELNANACWAGDYYFRGLFQHATSASAGLDYEADGLYAGTWAADVGDGLEADGYLGWQGKFEDICLSAGFTGCYCSGDDDTYEEIKLGFGHQFATVDLAFGEYDNFAGPALDFSYYSLTLEQDRFFARYAGFSRDFDGDNFELGYGSEAERFDLAVTLLSGDCAENGAAGEALGAISAHGVVGVWGLLAVPITNEGAKPGTQLPGTGSIFAWVFLTSLLAWFLTKLAIGCALMRSTSSRELT